jgi:hypothetical protein
MWRKGGHHANQRTLQPSDGNCWKVAVGGRCGEPVRTHHVGDIVVEAVVAAEGPESLKAGDIMGPEVATVRESEGLFEALC